jgi:hypothetical protein
MGSWLDDISSAVTNEWNDFKATGAPAIIAGAEQYAAQQLQGLAQGNTKQATKAAQEIMTRPSGPPSGLGASISDVFKNIAGSAGAKEYGPWVIGGIVGCLALGMFLRGK